MFDKRRVTVSADSGRGRFDFDGEVGERSTTTRVARPFDPLRWFAVIGFIMIAIFCAGFAATQAHFLRGEVLKRDASLTSQFIFTIAETQMRHARLDGKASLGQILDERTDFTKLGIDPRVARAVREEFYDHLRVLPDVLLANVFARDRKIIWATNPALIGTFSKGNPELEEAFAVRLMVFTEYAARRAHEKREQRFLDEPRKFFVENYVPLFNREGEVVAVVEFYKEPMSLIEALHKGNIVVWGCAALMAIFLYLALFWIVRRAGALLKARKQRLLDDEALCVIGEMSAAVAHGVRNPLSSIRTSAELALDGNPASSRKNAGDVVFQVDRLSAWVHDLLAFSQPIAGENQLLELIGLIDECQPHFATQLKNGRITCEVARPPSVPLVVGNRALATQALASVISNALEAMPDGGVLRVEIKPEPAHQRVKLIVADNGSGISAARMGLVFKPFFTTKSKGPGLGMAQVKRTMERFGGSVSLESEEGVGTRVTLSFRIAGRDGDRPPVR